jgi:hypothetical protein
MDGLVKFCIVAAVGWATWHYTASWRQWGTPQTVVEQLPVEVAACLTDRRTRKTLTYLRVRTFHVTGTSIAALRASAVALYSEPATSDELSMGASLCCRDFDETICHAAITELRNDWNAEDRETDGIAR